MAKPKKPSSKYLKIVCPRCKNSNLVYGKSTTKIKCTKCNLLLVKPTGGKTRIRAVIRRIINEI
jgi:small subunit ribosomal protein S27e